MRRLIDTHAPIWFCEGSPSLSVAVRAAMEDESNEKGLRREFRGARSFQTLVLTSRRNDRSRACDLVAACVPVGTLQEVRRDGTPRPTLGTNALPGFRDRSWNDSWGFCFRDFLAAGGDDLAS